MIVGVSASTYACAPNIESLPQPHQLQHNLNHKNTGCTTTFIVLCRARKLFIREKYERKAFYQEVPPPQEQPNPDATASATATGGRAGAGGTAGAATAAGGRMEGGGRHVGGMGTTWGQPQQQQRAVSPPPPPAVAGGDLFASASQM